MVDEDVPGITYSKQMGVTHNDFFRILPKAMGEHRYELHGNTVVGQVHGGSVEIVLGPQLERRIALLRIPYAEVSFSFNRVSEAEAEAFRKHFDLYFQRGGG